MATVIIAGFVIVLFYLFVMRYMPGKPMVCTRCLTLGVPVKKTKGNFVIELILWCFIIVPGLIYSAWRMSSKYYACTTCGSTELVPPDSPMGIELQKKEPKTIKDKTYAS